MNLQCDMMSRWYIAIALDQEVGSGSSIVPIRAPVTALRGGKEDQGEYKNLDLGSIYRCLLGRK